MTRINVQNSIDTIRALPRTATVGQQPWLDIHEDGRINLRLEKEGDRDLRMLVDSGDVPTLVDRGAVQQVKLPSGVVPARLADWMQQDDVLDLLLEIAGGMNIDSSTGRLTGSLTPAGQADLRALRAEAEELFGGPEAAERLLTISAPDAAEWLEDARDTIQAFATPDEAVADVLAEIDDDGVTLVDALIYLNRRDVEAGVRRIWAQEHRSPA